MNIRKTFLDTSALVLTLVAASSLATANSQDNNRSRQLYVALVNAGAASDCGAGTCGVEATNVSCIVHGNSVGRRSYECTLTTRPNGRDAEQARSSGSNAQNLQQALINVGVIPQCGAGTCEIAVQSVTCLMHGNATNQRTYECHLN